MIQMLLNSSHEGFMKFTMAKILQGYIIYIKFNFCKWTVDWIIRIFFLYSFLWFEPKANHPTTLPWIIVAVPRRLRTHPFETHSSSNSTANGSVTYITDILCFHHFPHHSLQGCQNIELLRGWNLPGKWIQFAWIQAFVCSLGKT